jgi:3-deoxy-D-manno-octulosonic-acid transferase
VQQVYLPYDLCWAVAKFIRAFQPKLGLFMETEAWPTVVFYCAQIGLPLFLVNARLSHRSALRVQRFGKAGRALFQAFRGILAQTEFDAERYRGLGVRSVQVVGNLKFDVALDRLAVQRGKAWQQDLLQQQRLIVCAASTRDGEEAIILRAWKALLASQVLAVPPLLCLVPRHPERFPEVGELIRHADLSFCRRSEWDGIPQVSADTQIILGDSMGEMPMYYAASNLVVMGGTLLPFGGQNLIEACATGCPVVLGEFTYNFQQATLDAIAAGAAMRLPMDTNADPAPSLQESLQFLLSNSALLKKMSSAAFEYSLAHQGATQKILTALERQLQNY